MKIAKEVQRTVAKEENIDIRAIVYKILQGWYLFLIFGLLGLLGGSVYNHYSAPVYQVKATLFIPRVATGIEAGFEGLLPAELMENQSEVYNQLEILKSYYVHYLVAQRLNWRTSWYRKDQISGANLLKRKDMFHWVTYYKEEPFRVEETQGAANLTGIRLYVKPLKDKQYKVSSNFEVTLAGEKKIVDFETVGTFGQPFANDYFHFTLYPTSQSPAQVDCHYSFVFNDLTQLAGSYRSKLSVGLHDKESDLIVLQMAGKNPQRELDYLNELIAVYMENKVSFQTATHQQSLRFIEQQLTGISDSLTTAEDNFSRFRSQNQLIDISRQSTQVLGTLQKVETNKNKNQLQLDYFNNLLGYLNKSQGQNEIVSPSVVGIQDATFIKMVLKMGELFSRRQVISFSAREDNPTLRMINDEIAQITANLKENMSSLIRNAEVEQASLVEQEQDILSQLNKLPRDEQDLINYKRRYELTSKTYTYLLHRRAEISIALAGATSDVRVIDPARPETTRLTGLSSNSRLMIGLLSGLALPGLFLMSVFFLSNTIVREEEIENHTLLPVLGNVIHSRLGSDTPVNDHPNSGIAEAYRNIRTNLKFMMEDSGQNIIAIHSLNPGEGKSFTSVNLATILAMNNKKVILVGCDMRKPKLHMTLKSSNEHGLSTYLSRQDELEEIIVETAIENLSLISAGPLPPHPTELMNQPRMGQLLKSLSSRYNYVLLDNAPIAYVSDGLIAGRLADLNIIILRYGQSKKEQINYINQLDRDKIINNIAILVNDISGTGFGIGRNYYYQYKHHYGHGYYEEPHPPSGGLKGMFGKKRAAV